MNGIDTKPDTHLPKKPKLTQSLPISQSEIESEFTHHDPAVARINNGSFGSCPKSVISAQQIWQLKFLSQPDNFYFNELKKGILQSRLMVKDLINAEDVDEISIVDNATTAAAIVLQSVSRAFFQGTYNKGDVAVDVDMKEIGADFYTSNLHKWFFCPPSVAFLYCKKSSKWDDLHHPVVSHEYGNGLAIESAWIGTRDYSSQLVVPQVLEFVTRFEGGILGIKKRNHDMVVEMGEMLAKAWGTHIGCPPEMCSSMIMVGLPACLKISSDSDALKLRTRLRDKFFVEVPICYRRERDGEVDPVTGYARISYQIYNKPGDYYMFRDAINQLVHDGFTCALLP